MHKQTSSYAVTATQQISLSSFAGEWRWMERNGTGIPPATSTFTLLVWPASHEWKALPCHAWGWRQSPLRTPRTFSCSLHGYKMVQRDGTLESTLQASHSYIGHLSNSYRNAACRVDSGHEGIAEIALLCRVCDWLVLDVWRHPCYKSSVPKCGHCSPGECTRQWTKSSIETGDHRVYQRKELEHQSFKRKRSTFHQRLWIYQICWDISHFVTIS